MIQPPEGNLGGDRPVENRGQQRVRQHTGSDVEGFPEEEGLDEADAKERLEQDPEEEPNATDPEADPNDTTRSEKAED